MQHAYDMNSFISGHFDGIKPGFSRPFCKCEILHEIVGYFTLHRQTPGLEEPMLSQSPLMSTACQNAVLGGLPRQWNGCTAQSEVCVSLLPEEGKISLQDQGWALHLGIVPCLPPQNHHVCAWHCFPVPAHTQVAFSCLHCLKVCRPRFSLKLPTAQHGRGH